MGIHKINHSSNIDRANMEKSHVKLISALAIGTLTAGIVWLTIRRKRNRKYEEFVLAGKVDQLFIYPVKSCRGNKVDWLDCAERGSRHGEERDRQFLLVDSMQDNVYIRAVLYPKMVTVEAQVEQAKLTLKFPKEGGGEHDQLVVDLDKVCERNEKRSAKYYYDELLEGLDCGEEVARKFDEFLNVRGRRAFRLICFADEQTHKEWDGMQKREEMCFQDLASYMGFSLNSLLDVNQRLAKKDVPNVDARNFRPNLVLSGLPAFDEDCWLRVRAGQAEFVYFNQCIRCVLTTINPGTGIKCAKMEPLRELKKYRISKTSRESPVFGANLALVKAGRVKVGDSVWIQYKSRPF